MKHVDESTLKEIVRRLVAEFRPEAIIMFGSHAWGAPTDDSDLDLLVIVTESGQIPPARDTRAYGVMAGIRCSMDVLVQTRDEVEPYRDLEGSFFWKILREGKVLYGHNEVVGSTRVVGQSGA